MDKLKNGSTKVLMWVSALVLLSAIGLLWLVVAREAERKDLLFEYEAYRASSALVDEYRRDQTFSVDEDKRVLGFGLYFANGVPAYRYGTAPDQIGQGQLLGGGFAAQRGNGLPGSVYVAYSDQKRSITLLRASGVQNPQRMMGQSFSGPMMGYGRGRQGLLGGAAPGAAAPQAQPDSAPASPENAAPQDAPAGPEASAQPGAALANGLVQLVWIEYASSGSLGAGFQLVLMAALISLVLLGLYLVLIIVFRHNERLRAREAENRELVQLGEAARTLVHEIKNPLGIMKIQTAKIRRAAGQTGVEPTVARTANDSADLLDGEIARLSGLADRIREFLKSSQARVSTVDLVPFLGNFTQRYAGNMESGIDFSFEPGDLTSAMAAVDGEKLLIALDNIVANAIEAVQHSDNPNKRVDIRLYFREGAWVIAVMDTGPGIPPELQRRVFDPFFTTKEKGSGIGLALSKRLVESFGAKLAFEQRDGGQGAVFLIEMRAAKREIP